MPATLKHIQINFERVATFPGIPDDLRALARVKIEEAQGDYQRAWREFVATADAKHLGDKIPGTVGRTFARQYGTLAKRSPRGQRVAIRLSPAALHAVDKHRRSSDQIRLIEGHLVFTNRPLAVKALTKMVMRCASDLRTPPKESAAERNALKALLKKVDVSASNQ